MCSHHHHHYQHILSSWSCIHFVSVSISFMGFFLVFYNGNDPVSSAKVKTFKMKISRFFLFGFDWNVIEMTLTIFENLSIKYCIPSSYRCFGKEIFVFGLFASNGRSVHSIDSSTDTAMFVCNMQCADMWNDL